MGMAAPTMKNNSNMGSGSNLTTAQKIYINQLVVAGVNVPYIIALAAVNNGGDKNKLFRFGNISPDTVFGDFGINPNNNHFYSGDYGSDWLNQAGGYFAVNNINLDTILVSALASVGINIAPSGNTGGNVITINDLLTTEPQTNTTPSTPSNNFPIVGGTPASLDPTQNYITTTSTTTATPLTSQSKKVLWYTGIAIAIVIVSFFAYKYFKKTPKTN